MKNLSNTKYVDLMLIIACIIWGTGFVATKVVINEGIEPFYLMGIRFAIAAVLLLIIFGKSMKEITAKELKGGSIMGFFLFISFAFQTIGIKFTTPSKNAFLTALNVIFVPFLYWILVKKRPDSYTFISSFMSLIGIALLSLNENFTLSFGDVLSIFCAIGFAAHIIATGIFSKDGDSIRLNIIQMSLGSLLSFAAALFFEAPPHGASTLGWLSLVYLGLFSTLIAFLLQTIAQKHVSSSRTAIIFTTEALFGTIFSILILKEHVTLKMLAGGLLIILAVIIIETKLDFFKKNFKKIN